MKYNLSQFTLYSNGLIILSLLAIGYLVYSNPSSNLITFIWFISNAALVSCIALFRTELWIKMKLFVLRKQGYKQIFHFRDDMTIKRFVKKPNDNNQVEVDKRMYSLNPKAVFRDLTNNIETIITTPSSQTSISPMVTNSSDARLIGMLSLESLYAGKKLAKKSEEELKLYLIAAIIIGIIAIAIGVVNYINLNELVTMANVGAPAAVQAVRLN